MISPRTTTSASAPANAAPTTSARSPLLRGTPPRLSLAPITAAFLAIALMVLLGLIAADRMIVREQRTEARLDAARTALITSNLVNGQVQALRGLHAVFLDGAMPTPERVETVLDALGTAGMEFRRLWVVDTTGRVLSDQRFGRDLPGGPARLTRIDTATSPDLAGLVAAAASSQQPQVWAATPSATGVRGFLILDPVVVGGRLTGFIAAQLSDATMEDALRTTADPARELLLVLSGADTVAHLDALAPPEDRSSGGPGGLGERIVERADVPLPEGIGSGTGAWRVVVVHRHGTLARLTLWGVAALFLFVLGLALWNERRQLQRLADRSHELEHLGAELLRANRTKSEFLANVSHELRTPLNAIVGFAELLREGVYGTLSSKQLGPLDRIEASAGHLRQLVDQVLDLAKMAAGRLEVHTEPISLRPFMLDVATELEPLINERSLALSLSVPAMLPKVRTDPTHLRQILLNLMGNAVKFTHTGGISVRGRLVLDDDASAEASAWRGSAAVTGGAALRENAPNPAQSWVALQVVDTGVGIDPRNHARIFEEFEQVNPGARGDSMRRGTGLGLPLSRRLAHFLGGEVTVESRLGEGATFTLWLPVDAADLATAALTSGRPRRIAVGTIQDGSSVAAAGDTGEFVVADATHALERADAPTVPDTPNATDASPDESEEASRKESDPE